MTETKTVNLTELSKQIYQANKEKGFWDEEKNVGEVFALIISEASEALEAHRKDIFANMQEFDKWMLAERIEGTDRGELFIDLFKSYIKDSVEDEIADVVIRVLDFVGFLEYEMSTVDTTNYNIIINNFGEMIADLNWVISDAYKSRYDSSYSMANLKLENIIRWCYAISESLNFDLDRHIELKLKYNATRPYKHGKKFHYIYF